MDTSEQVKGQNSFFGFTAGFCSHVGPPASKISWGVGRRRVDPDFGDDVLDRVGVNARNRVQLLLQLLVDKRDDQLLDPH